MEDQSNAQPSLLQHAAKWGLITGGISIALTSLLYAVDYTLMVQLKVLFIMLLIYLVVTIYAGMDFRKNTGGYLAYGKAFLHGFAVLAVSALVASLFSLLLYQVIDSDLPDKLTKASVENTRELMESMGAPADSIDEALDAAEKSTSEQFTVMGQVKGYFSILIFSAIMALISALFVRKNEPLEV